MRPTGQSEVFIRRAGPKEARVLLRLIKEFAEESGEPLAAVNEALRHRRRRTHSLREPLKVTGHEHARGRRREEHVHIVTVADGLRSAGKADDGLHRVGFGIGDEFHEDAATHARSKALDDLNHPWVLNNRRVSQKLLRR